MSDLANVYQLFRSKFEGYDFQYYYPPTYVRMITESKDKIIFAYRENHNSSANNKYQPLKSSPPGDIISNSLNLTGSPLKDEQCEVDGLELSSENDGPEFVLQKCWTPDEETYGPLNTEDARSIIQNFINLDCKVGRGDIWALCSGTDSERTVLLQLAVNSDEGDQRKFVRGVVRSTGVHRADSIKMAHLVEIHRQRAEGMKFGQKIFLRQWYNLCPHITLRLSWQTAAENAGFAFERNAHVRLSQRFPVNCGSFSRNSPADYFWQQLQRLAMMKDKILDIRANRESGYANGDICADGLMEVNLDYVKQKVSNILSTFISGQPTNFVHSDIASMVELVRLRNLTDVMERLYDALTLCSSYDDLKAAIDYIFHLSTHSNIVNVPTTGTRFAQLILAMIQDRLAIPSLTPSEPYELLLECGFAKLMNDYRLIFAECGIYELEFEKLFQSQPTNTRKSRYGSAAPPPSQEGHRASKSSLFQPAIEVTRSERSILLSNFNEEEAKTKLNRLAQVHLLLEHLLSLERYVQIPSIYGRVCDAYLSQRPVSLGELYSRDIDLLELDLNEFQLMDLAQKRSPFGRRVSMSSSNLLQRMETVFLQYGQPIFPDCFFSEPLQEDDLGTSETYWCYEYDKIERL